MEAVIISGGTPPSLDLIKKQLEGEQTILICADSGANHLYKYNIKPDYLIGDFDSIDAEILECFSKSNCIIEQYPIEKDYTDTQLALKKALDIGATSVIFLGCTGSRLDHTLGNLGLLAQCLDFKIKACIKDNNNTIWLTDVPTYIRGKKGEYFSLLAYGSSVDSLTIEGSKYDLNNYNLSLGSSLTLSNQFVENEIKISFKKGILLITKSFD
jgi:thiamine pyrophosphokinase